MTSMEREHERRTARPKPPSERPLRILLVEDHFDSAEAMATVLRNERHLVEWVSTGAAALDLFVENDIGRRLDLILLDLMLPDTNGARLVEELRLASPIVPPIVVLSAKPLQAIRSEADALGAVAHLRKPFGVDELLRVVHRATTPPEHRGN